jgi:hypothetical protein
MSLKTIKKSDNNPRFCRSLGFFWNLDFENLVVNPMAFTFAVPKKAGQN